MRGFLIALGFMLGLPISAQAEVTVAVASNFQTTLEALRPGFEAASGEKLVIVAGSTGKLVAQIKQGAPFDVLLAADDRATGQVQGVAGSEFTYALGQLVLLGADSPEALKGNFRHLAIANPALAPYGRAAQETVAKLGLAEATAAKIVMGENVAQAFTLVESGNAELGFVALSQVKAKAKTHWLVPAEYHAPIRQNAVALREGSGASAFMNYARSDAAKAVIRAAGYEVP